MRKYFNLIFLSVLILACGKDDSNFQPKIEERGYFPSEIGDYWDYEVFDKIQNSISNVKVSVVKDTIINTDTYMIWEYSGHPNFNFELVKTYPDSVIFFDYENLNILRKYKFPPGKFVKWAMKSQWDTAFYGGIDTVKIDNYSFDAEMIYFGWSANNYWFLENVSIGKQVGILKRIQKEFNTWPSINEEWILIESNLLP